MKSYNCYIYGAGNFYNRLSGYLSLYVDVLHVEGIVTTQSPESNTLDGYKRLSVSDANFDEIDFVIIAAYECQSIYLTLYENNVDENKILLGKIFELPSFNIEKYLEVRASRPSIIANSCLAGRIYKELGLKMLSPTINMACFNGKSFIDFCHGLNSEKTEDIKECQETYPLYDGSYNREFFIPRVITGNKTVWMHPHEDVITTIENWKRRYKRLNFDNLWYVMIALSDSDAYLFEKLPSEHKLGFYYKDLGLKSIVYTPEWNDTELQRRYDYNYVMYIHRYATNVEGVSRIDWIRFLSGDKNYLRW